MPRRGHVLVPREGSPALLVRGVLVLHVPAITPSPHRKEWVGLVRRVPARTALGKKDSGRLVAALRQRRAGAKGFRECLDLTQR